MTSATFDVQWKLALTVKCNLCGAQVGKNCRDRTTGITTPNRSYHPTRVEQAKLVAPKN